MGKGTHFLGLPVFGQLISLLSKSEILKFSRENGGECYVKHFDFVREISDLISPEARKLGHLGMSVMPRRSTFSDANARRLEMCSASSTAVCTIGTRTSFLRAAAGGRFLYGSCL